MTRTGNVDLQNGSAAFYSHFCERLQSDFVHGNPRIEAAIGHAISWIPADAHFILDVGCGIGWSSWEIKRTYPSLSVTGIDLSSGLVDTARRLFETPGLTFHVGDVICIDKMMEQAFDAIVMLDVYEHIPKQKRQQLHIVLRRLLADKGRLILSCPTVGHQNSLRQKGEGLQPVDEDVTEEDVVRIAEDIGGRLIYFNNVTIWNPDDYFHAVIERAKNGPRPQQGEGLSSPALEPKQLRRQRVKERLGIRIMRDGLIVADRGEATVCVVAPMRDAYSETFVRAHIGRLPARVFPLHGEKLTTLQDEQGPLVPPFTLRRHVKESVARRLRGMEWEDFQRTYVREYLQAKGVDAVLTEYGHSGVMMMDACREAGIPLIVHFHGFDAYNMETLATVGQRYPELFESAVALIAVSRDMERQLVTLGASPENVHYNPCGVDINNFHVAQPDLALPHFVAVGRFVDKKAPLLTILAFEQVVQTLPEAQLTMIGEGYLLESSRQLARNRGLSKAIDFCGIQSHAEVAAILQTARAFVQHSVTTSYGDAEGTPVAILEAGASGLPVVATSHKGIADVIIHGETGFLVEEEDVDGMARYMRMLARKPNLAAKMGRAARERIAANFSMEKSISGLWHIIEAAILDGSS